MRLLVILPWLSALAAGLPAQIQTGSMTGLHTGDQFGATIVPFYDHDGDGTVDILVGCTGWDNGTATNAGRVELRSGRTGALLRTNNGTNTNDYFGSSLAVLDDLNGDGVPEYLVGVPYADNGGPDSGAIKVFSGRTGALLFNRFLQENNAQLGTCVVALPDIDQDGIGDYAASAPHNTNSFPLGRLYYFSGLTGNVISYRTGFSSAGLYATSLAVVGDVDGNGTEDLVVGSPYEFLPQTPGAGIVEVISLGNLQRVLTLNGTGYQSHYGAAVAALGDLDGDGRAEFAIGIPDGGFGSVDIMRGNGTRFRWHLGSASGTRYGLAISSVGDVDFDGVPDYAIGEPLASGHGDTFVYSGSGGAEIAHLTAGSSGAYWGRTIALVGDTNQDNFAEFAISMPNQGNGELRLFSLTKSPSFSVFGSSCSINPAGPSLGLNSGGRVGALLELRPDTTPIGSGLGVAIFGWSNTVSQGVPLPLSLAPNGLPGCQLLVAPDLVFGTIQSHVRSVVSLMIPQVPELVGQWLFAQYALFHAGGVAFTDGMGVRFGTPF